MNKRFVVLDSFRGIFAFIVAICHFKSAGPISNLLLIQKGSHFVDFFFVLSGFIIYHNYSNLTAGRPQIKFMTNRFYRLYPLHLLMLLVFLALEVGKFILFSQGIFKSPVFEKNNLTSFVVNLFFLQSFNITTISWNYPSWSISAEMVAYLLFCFSVVYISTVRKNLRIIAFLAISIISLFLIRLTTGKLNLEITSEYSMFRCIYGFFIGCATYELYNANRGIKISFACTIMEIFTLSLSIITIIYLPESYNFLLPLLYSLTVVIFAFEKGVISTWLSTTFFLRMGELSYSVYMTHAAVAIIFEVFIKILKIDSPITLSISLVIYLVSIYHISKITHKYIEVKLRKRLQSKSAKFDLPLQPSKIQF